MKEEDTDWMIYHIIAGKPAVTTGDLVSASGLDAAAVASSLARLRQALLIEREEDTVRVLSFGECLIKTQVKYANDFPFVIEDGVIKEKKQ
jgi:Mn-dependent DtxR family transcriptional regulator